MTVIETSSPSDIENAIAAGGVVVVDFGAESWCVPCRRLRPHYDAAAERLPDATLIRADIDENPELVDAYGIQGVPRLLAYKGGVYYGDVTARTAIALVEEISNI